MHENTSTIDGEAKISRGELATLTGVRDSTLKYYSENGLLPYDQAGKGLARRYEPRLAIARLREIEDLQSMGVPIDDIRAQFRGRSTS